MSSVQSACSPQLQPVENLEKSHVSPLTRPMASAFLLTHAALTRLLQLDVVHQVAAESVPPVFDVQEHDQVIALDVEVFLAQKVAAAAEIVTGHEPGGASYPPSGTGPAAGS